MSLRTVPVGMVGIDNNSMKAYLAMMAKYGMQPRTIIYLKSPIGGTKFNLLKSVLGEEIARVVYLKKQYLFQRKYKKFSRYFSGEIDVGRLFFSPPDYAKRCHNYYEVETNDINDPKVIDTLKLSGEQAFIYGGGGLVKAELFNLGIKFMHTHPGYLPYVRGSHGIYWSLLLRGKYGCTTFYMNQGIDTGAIIHAKEYETSIFSMPAVDVVLADKLMFFYIDPLIRAMTLIDVMIHHNNFHDIINSPQDNSLGEAFYSMHPKLRYKLIERILTSSTLM